MLLPEQDAKRARLRVERSRPKRPAAPRAPVTTPYSPAAQSAGYTGEQGRRGRFNVRSLLQQGVERRATEEQRAIREDRPYVPGPEDALDIGTGARPLRSLILNPSDPVGAVRQSLDPRRTGGDFQLRNAGGIRSLPDTDIIGPLSVRDIAGGAADILADPGVAFAAAKAAPAAGRGVRALAGALDDGGEAALRAATPPVDRSLPMGITSAVPTDQGVRRVRNVAGAALDPDEAARTTEEAVGSLRDALRAEVGLRRSGVVASEIAEGRAGQAARIAGGLEQARAAGGGLEESLQAARTGARAGQLRRTFNAPLELTTAHKDALAARLQDALQGDGPFAQFNGLQALDRLIRGESVQPAQLKLLRRALGDEVADSARLANRGRPSAVAKLDDAARAEIERARPFTERQIATYEQRAVAQHRLADGLAADLGMDPTNARLRRTVDEARAKALNAENRADELLVGRAQKLAGIPDEAPAALAQQKATFGRVNALRAAEAAQRAGNATPEQGLILQARDLIGRKLTVAPNVEDEMLQSLDYWTRGNRAILDGIGETAWRRMANVAASVSGNLSDSYLTALFQRRALVEGALTNQGFDPSIARRIGGLLTDQELARRYPGGIPERLAREIERTASLEVGSAGGDVLRGMASASQEWKNLAFGPADVGIFGQQVLKAATTSPSNILAGAVNRVLAAMHLPSVPTSMLDEVALSKRLQYQLDGVPQGVTTGIVQGFSPDAGTALRFVPGLRRLDPALSRWIEFSTDLQFRRVLGGLRNLNYEGNLVALHLTGQDITNPAVRATAAGMANSATSYAPRALRTGRALAESAVLMTPSMRRAQVTGILQLARVFSPTARASERILGSIAIANLAGSTLAVGKLLNDQIGVGDFEFDPSKPGFGNIVTGQKNSKGEHVVVNLFPQQQVTTTILKATRALAEGDPQGATEAWGKLFLSSSGPAAQLAEKAAGFGYQPGSGYKFGDLGEGQSGGRRALNLLPLPPIFQSYANEGVTPWADPFQFGAEFGGVPNYPESAYGEQERILGGSDALTGRERTQALAGSPEGMASLQRRDQELLESAAAGDRTAQALAVSVETRQRLASLAAAGLSGGDYREERKTVMGEQRGKQDVYADVFEGFRESDIPAERDAAAYFDLFDQAQTAWGTTDYDRFEELEAEYAAQVGPARWDAVQEQLGLADPRLPEQEQEYRQVRADLEASGYFDLGDQAWAATQKAIPAAQQYATYYDWRNATLQKFKTNLEQNMPPGVAEAEAARMIAQFPQAELYSQFKNARETQWAAKNPAVADTAMQWGYFTSNAGERGIITGQLSGVQ